MPTWTTVCERARQLPDAELGTQHGAPAWRVGGKVFVQLNPRLRVPDEEALVDARGDRIMLLTEPDERRALVEADPDTFVVTPHYESSRFVVVWLDSVATDHLAELVEEAWRLRASRPQRRRRDGSDPAAH